MDGLKWLAAHTNPLPAPPASHPHPICPCDLNPLVDAPCDAIALGVIMAMVAWAYLDFLPVPWWRLKRFACPFSPVQGALAVAQIVHTSIIVFGCLTALLAVLLAIRLAASAK